MYSYIFFAIAGGFTHYQVGKVKIGAFVGFAETVAAFDQRQRLRGRSFSASSMVSSDVEHSETTTAPAAIGISCGMKVQ